MSDRVDVNLVEQAVQIALKRLKELEISSLLYKVSGIKWFVVSFEGLPLRFYHISAEKAEDIAALLENFSRRLDEHLLRLEGFQTQTLLMGSGDVELLAFKEHEMLYLLSMEKWIAASLEKLLDQLSKDKEIKCPRCNANLTYRVFECKTCKSTIPFFELICPKCKTPHLTKRCPICNNVIKHEESKLIRKAKKFYPK
ncbi:MAG: hypothetical protein DRJ31_05830 [Candidatus Methanomethylicota archaeon]|uniref:DZANK-type domain-containing protein n=1 Tax=Thermoproteota archaeon TaxID=2056631 RepID=A0A497EPU9_9CREN|nr:MAG: hypothetical protein DRJ31_05830 [Candidatus Verstraetearchaeota archaeon]RLE53357.1 MAG: hypothetical protein DRJ33_01280 [Candidatus Verstraetearchaeota archaeon]